ncbi:Hypothetical Protein FCC1311_085472 [Hondaea fermentalgiana]|uniref:Uncharacterized protein n=1 Tax=Hondaea fermentalgiana TaxID=2315210 RepID=A0A2R5GN44_9STRA|nr:Hypothetical Protein FCC1311_085472 [Hondaea fermentalgiana]|eukprot:GBG32322.1 Hypothetical Protein FCC1311_085472 [Hondaea fermentalgiana]
MTSLDLKWMLMYLETCNSRVVHPEEVQILSRFLQGASSARELALVVLILETLQVLNVKECRLQAVTQYLGMLADPHELARSWPTIIKRLQTHLVTSDQKFEEREVGFLLRCILQDYRHAFQAGDKTKAYGPFANRTFWADIAFRFNVEFPQRRRGVVAIRNKIKNLLAEPASPTSQRYGQMVVQLAAVRRDASAKSSTASPSVNALNQEKARASADFSTDPAATRLDCDLYMRSPKLPLDPIDPTECPVNDEFKDEFAQEVFALLLCESN